MLRVEIACADRDQLGEGPLWDVNEQRLYWIDSYGPAIHRMDPNGAKETWRVPEPIGSVVLRRDGGAILSLRSGFFAFDFKTGDATRICETQPGELGLALMTARPIGRGGKQKRIGDRSHALPRRCRASFHRLFYLARLAAHSCRRRHASRSIRIGAHIHFALIAWRARSLPAVERLAAAAGGSARTARTGLLVLRQTRPAGTPRPSFSLPGPRRA
jgi:SMP-30/Gluconolactonase/LRE-like region